MTTNTAKPTEWTAWELLTSEHQTEIQAQLSDWSTLSLSAHSFRFELGMWSATFRKPTQPSQPDKPTQTDDVCGECGGQGGEPGEEFGDRGFHPCYKCNGTGRKTTTTLPPRPRDRTRPMTTLTLTTAKKAQKNASRRANYGDRKVSNKIDQRAAEILATDPTMGLATARSQALREMIRDMK